MSSVQARSRLPERNAVRAFASGKHTANRMRDDLIVADFAEAWLAKFPRIEERGLGPRLLAALAGMSGGPNAVDDLDDVEVIAAALLELVAMLKAAPAG